MATKKLEESAGDSTHEVTPDVKVKDNVAGEDRAQAGDSVQVEDLDTKELKSGGLKLNIGDPVPSEAAYGAPKIGSDLTSYIDEVADTVRIGFDQSIAILTPWFFNNMPDVYYQTTPKAEKIKHLSTIITGHVFETKQTVELWNREHDKVTYIGPGNDRKITMDMAHRLSMVNQRVKMGFLYFSRDHLLFLSSFICQEYKPLEENNTRITEKIEGARKILHKEFSDAKGQVDYFLKHLDNDFVMYATIARIQLTYHMVHYMLMHEGAHTTLHRIKDSSLIRLTLGVKGIESAKVFEQILSLFHRYGFSIVRSFLVNFNQHYREPISVVNFALDIDRNSNQKDTVEVSLIKLNKALRTLGWVDTDNYSTLGQKSFSINSINLVRSIADWTHIILSKRNFHYYSKHKVMETFFQHIELLKQVVSLFRLRFDPLLDRQQAEQDYGKLKQELAARVNQLVDRVERDVFNESVHFIDNLLKTNYFLPTKTGLAFRLSPAVLDKKHYPHEPFGIFFIVGLGYRFFHVRWKDISRGGVRIIAPRTTSDFNIALSGLFDEVYGLSHAQQLKNKDIPEGGSKGVLLIKPEIDKERAIHGAINAFLDLLVSMDESHENQLSQQVRYYNEDEIIYLGPDENVSDTMIEWIAAQAHRRGYRYANAFVSSKPKDGINHKRYAVTSEGLNVFVDHTLKQLGIDFRNQSFSVTMTGGPDGDVAGNELMILHREYGDQAKVKVVSDGKGVAYDPQGLDWQELLRLCRKGESIYAFNKKKVSDQGYVLPADSQENITLRNKLPLNTPADIFIPAGGRPYTVNEKNCALFFGADDTPTKKAIVEGANIFFTSKARDILQAKGILIIKDSSANKGGVICSSYEVLASLLLAPVEFAAIKELYVKEVVAILRDKAAREAKLLMREYVAHGRRKSLVAISMEISKQINSLKNLILEHFIAHPEELEQNQIYRQLILDNCPPVLVKKYANRVLDDLPQAHKLATLASIVASNVVYREGIGWIDDLSERDRLQISLVYVNQEQLTADFVAQVEGSSLRDKKRIADVLRAGATRNLTMMELIDRL